MASLVVIPRREDFFPHTKRGHGRGLGHRVRLVTDPSQFTQEHELCVDMTCQLNAPKSSNTHADRESNLREWCSEHGLRVYSKETPRAEFDTPMAAMIAATGGRE